MPPANAVVPVTPRQCRAHHPSPAGAGLAGHDNLRSMAAISTYLVGPTTSTVPNAERAWSSGRYMSSTVAEGCAKTPGETARTV